MNIIVVLMSTYNGEKYLREQIDSILAQQGCDVELFVRDDGSKDATTQILDEYKAKGQLDWYTGKNLGPGKSFFDISMHAPEAEYYAFADQDDYWMPDKLKTAIEMIDAEKNRDIPIMYCSRFVTTDAELKPLKNQCKENYGEITIQHALVENMMPGCTYVFNSKAMCEFLKFGIDNIDIHDWVLFRIIVALNGKVIVDNNPHILYRQHGNNCIGLKKSESLRELLQHFFDNRHCWRKCAERLLDIYGAQLSENNRKWLMVVRDYRTNIKYKLILLLSPKCRASNIKKTLKLKLRIALGLF